MAKLVEVYRNDDQKLTRRQLPLFIDDNLTMVMDLNRMGFVYDTPTVRGKELEVFLENYKSLNETELRQAFVVDLKDISAILDQTIPCVGCRRSVERLYEQLEKSGHPALEPLVILANGTLSIKDDHFSWPHLVCTLLHGHSGRLKQLVESQLRSKKSRRCMLHSLDASRVRASWKEVWSVMKQQCREEVLLIDAGTLMLTLEAYLQKHRFCADCRTKVLRAYWLLVEDPEPTREKGYIPALYAGIKRCLPDKHIHLPTSSDYVSALVARVQPDLIGSGGERHAKTLEIAQGEVITCLGLCVYERLHRIHMRLKEEETTCQVLAAIAIDALNRKFQMSVERKRGISKLELLYKELTKEELIKQQRKEQKKLKRKKRKERKAMDSKPQEEPGESACILRDVCSSDSSHITVSSTVSQSEETPCLCAGDATKQEANKENLAKTQGPPPLSAPHHCTTTLQKKSADSEKSSRKCVCWQEDWGYSSGGNQEQSSPGLACRHRLRTDQGVCREDVGSGAAEAPRRFTLSLEQMLEEGTCSDEDCFIPPEDVQEFQSRLNITQEREELRRVLRQRFAQLCNSRNAAVSSQ